MKWGSTIICGLAILFLFACKSSYLDSNEPMWGSNEVEEASLTNRLIKVVSYNIEESKNIDQAIWELRNTDELVNSDILLLQEMDENGVLKIADSLDMNYVYFPISNYKKDNRNVGNAVLANRIIGKTKKTILPNEPFIGKGRRMSCSAVLLIENKEVSIHSIHLETIVMRRKKRVEQLQFILDAINDESSNIKHFIIGGDFNTMFDKDIFAMNEILVNNGFNSNSENIGKTGTVPFDVIEPQLDHIYSKGFQFIDKGKCSACEASDHKPIWAIIKI